MVCCSVPSTTISVIEIENKNKKRSKNESFFLGLINGLVYFHNFPSLTSIIDCAFDVSTPTVIGALHRRNLVWVATEFLVV